LSFAQFEREVIGERIRDKIAASKQKGMWMGGVPPLGYQAQDRKLVIVDSEAEIVRFIFRRYTQLGSVRLLKDELEAQSVRSKLRTIGSGRISGGKPFVRGALYLMLQNRIYRGEIVHNQQSYLGEHKPICKSAWNKDPVSGVIGIQSGPPGRRVHNGFHGEHGGQVGDADCGDDCQGSSGLFHSPEADQGDLPRVSPVAQSRAQGDSVRSDRVSLRAASAAIAAD
ncbi:MAG: recombinase family protein, partial [Stellaceae bacterium]